MTPSNPPTTVPPVQRLGGAVLLQGAALLDARNLVVQGLRAAQRNGIAPNDRVPRLAQALTDAAHMSETRHDDTLSAVPVAESFTTTQIGTREAAQMLGCTQRQAQRLATDLDGRQLASRAWLFDRDTVHAYRLARESHRPPRSESNSTH